MSVKHFQAAVLGLALIGLAGCSNQPGQDVTVATIAKGMISKKKRPEPPDPQKLAASVQAAMAATDQPLVLVAFTGTGTVGVMQKIETNGNYDTYGTPDRRSMTLNRGIVTATRGLGDDLMSADVARVSALITGRKAGTAQRVQRHLDGENIIVALEATCTVTPGGTSQVAIESGQRKTVVMNESCRAQTASFDNSYQVDAATGRVLQSKQWISQRNGYVSVQSLR